MKKKTLITILSIIFIVVLIGILVILKNNAQTSGNLNSVTDVKKMFNSVYSKLDGQLPSLETQEIDVADENQVKFYTGLTSCENVEFLVVSEPMMSSQAYSAVALKVKNTANIETMKQEMLDNIDTNKWICVSASKVYVTNSDSVIFLIMADDTWAKLVYDGFKDFVNNNIGKELEKSTEEDFELPPEIILQ